MNVVVYGATGKTGIRIVRELSSRGHQVKAAVRNPAKLELLPGVTAVEGNLTDADIISRTIAGADAVVSAYGPPMDNTDELIGVTQRLADAVSRNPGQRLIIVGGAGSLFVAPNVTLFDSGSLPAEWIPIVKSHIAVYENIRKSDIDWTYFSPAAYFEPGQRTGKFRLGKDDLIVNEQGESRISLEDYSIALVDELERPQHIRSRFTIGY